MLNLSSLSSFSGMGTLTSYTKQLSMQNKWKQKKESGSLTAAPRYNPDDYKTEAGKAMAAQKNADLSAAEAYQEEQENKDTELEKIQNKLMYGETLSEDEIEYLRQKNPQAYNQVMAEKQDQKALEEKLKNARTKEEAQKVMQEHTNASLSIVKMVTGNPYISDMDKASLCAAEMRKLRLSQQSFEKFVKSGQYDRLPTDEEKAEAEKKIRESEEAEQSGTQNRTEEPEEPTQSPEPDQAEEPERAEEPEQTETTERSQKSESAADSETVQKAIVVSKSGGTAVSVSSRASDFRPDRDVEKTDSRRPAAVRKEK